MSGGIGAVCLRGGAVVCLVAALLLGGVSLVWARARARQPDDVARGRALFVESCLSCHGPDGEGTRYGPPIRDAGAAAADFQLRTGRMPLGDAGLQSVRKPPAFSPQQIDAIVAYVDSLGDGPAIPEVDAGAGDLALGRSLFANNCAPCHGANANGGAVGEDAIAPTLLVSEPLDVAEAVMTGPGQMPEFAFTSEERNSIVGFVDYLQDEPDPGGADIGGVGPVPEGFVAWTVGGVAILVACVFVGHRRRADNEDGR